MAIEKDGDGEMRMTNGNDGGRKTADAIAIEGVTGTEIVNVRGGGTMIARMKRNVDDEKTRKEDDTTTARTRKSEGVEKTKKGGGASVKRTIMIASVRGDMIEMAIVDETGVASIEEDDPLQKTHHRVLDTSKK